MENIQLNIDKKSPLPLYHQIQEGIKNLILRGDFQINQRIPSENELAQQFGVTPMTVRQAMNGLVHEGLVYRERGKGTFVSPRKMKHSLERLTSFSEDMKSRGLNPASTILVFENIPAPEEVARALALEEGKEIQHIKRLRYSNGEPVGIHDSFLNLEFPITEDELIAFESLYQLLDSKGISIKYGEDTIEAVQADVALSKLLKVPRKAPLLQVKRVAIDANHRKIEYVAATYRGDFYQYTIRLNR